MWSGLRRTFLWLDPAVSLHTQRRIRALTCLPTTNRRRRRNSSTPMVADGWSQSARTTTRYSSTHTTSIAQWRACRASQELHSINAHMDVGERVFSEGIDGALVFELVASRFAVLGSVGTISCICQRSRALLSHKDFWISVWHNSSASASVDTAFEAQLSHAAPHAARLLVIEELQRQRVQVQMRTRSEANNNRSLCTVCTSLCTLASTMVRIIACAEDTAQVWDL